MAREGGGAPATEHGATDIIVFHRHLRSPGDGKRNIGIVDDIPFDRDMVRLRAACRLRKRVVLAIQWKIRDGGGANAPLCAGQVVV